MTPDEAAALRAEFPGSRVGVLPQPYEKNAPKSNCGVCGKYHGLPAMHLDFVGHGAVTERLLEVDPEWTWEPMAYTPEGLPALDPWGNLWIRLTVAGVTRPGVGDGASMKVCIGDAIRNAAMRFGVALDLWIRGDGEDEKREGTESMPDAPPDPRKVARGDARDRIRLLSGDGQAAVRAFCDTQQISRTPSEWSDRDLNAVVAVIAAREAEEASGTVGPDGTPEAATGDPGGRSCACGSTAVGIYDGEALCDEHAPAEAPS